MSERRSIPIALIDDTDRLRPVDPDRAAALAVMFEDAGQLQPIEVRPRGEGFKLTFGAHRLAAARLLGWTEIAADIVERDEREARLAEIDENLGRHELSVIDRAVFMVERKQVWEELHPETRQGAAPKGKNKVANLATFAQRFTAEVAEKCGLSERSIRRACQLAEALGPDAIAILRGTSLADNQSELLALARLDPDARKKALKLFAKGEAAKLGDALAALGLKTAVDPEEALFRTLVGAWSRAKAKTRRRFLAHVDDSAKGGKTA